MAAGKVVVARKLSGLLALEWGYDFKPDMVFIDGGHDYTTVALDIAIAYSLLVPGGLLCGHDFSNDWPGVQQAVRELVPDYQRVPGGDIWFKEMPR